MQPQTCIDLIPDDVICLLANMPDEEAESWLKSWIDMHNPSRMDFLTFVKTVNPNFVIEEVHVIIADGLERLARGEINRLIVSLPPRTGKSQLCSVYFPAWYLGNYDRFQDGPQKVLQISHSATKASEYGKETRNLIKSDDYIKVFGHGLRKDSTANDNFHTERNSSYHAAGVDSGIAGYGFHLGVVDDPISEQDAYSPKRIKSVNDWFGPGFSTRQQPDGSSKILLVMTRWQKHDLAGFVTAQAKAAKQQGLPADNWEVIAIPAELDEAMAEKLNKVTSPHIKDPVTYKKGDSYAPRRFSLDFLRRIKSGMSEENWSALYLQNPMSEDGGILKRKYWRIWKQPKPPECEYIIQVYDTAFEAQEKNDFSARTTWGIFTYNDPDLGPRSHAILLERWKCKVELPELMVEAVQSYKERKPDRVLIEKKASGHSMLQEMRRRGIPVAAIELPRGSRSQLGKIPRAHAASAVLEQGCIWAPDKEWAKEVINECAEFPNGEYHDLVDTCVHAMNYLRKHFHLQLPYDEDDEQAETPARNYF